MANLKWLETEYCGSASETVQPVLVNDNTLLYVLFSKGCHYVFATIYKLHFHWSGYNNQYLFTCETEEELEKYLKNYGKGNKDIRHLREP